MSTITIDDVVSATLEVLKERGDEFVYEKVPSVGFGVCQYSVDGGQTGSCLFGAALIEKLGVPYDAGWDTAGGKTIEVVLERLGVDVDKDYSKLTALSCAQSDQDRGNQYGAVRRNLEHRLAQS